MLVVYEKDDEVFICEKDKEQEMIDYVFETRYGAEDRNIDDFTRKEITNGWMSVCMPMELCIDYEGKVEVKDE